MPASAEVTGLNVAVRVLLGRRLKLAFGVCSPGVCVNDRGGGVRLVVFVVDVVVFGSSGVGEHADSAAAVIISVTSSSSTGAYFTDLESSTMVEKLDFEGGVGVFSGVNATFRHRFINLSFSLMGYPSKHAEKLDSLTLSSSV